MKKINLLIIGIVCIALVGAAVSLSISNVSYPEISEKEIPSEDTFTFLCNGTLMTTQASEQDDRWDEGDVLSVVRKVCSLEVTSIKKGVDYWKENEFGLKSFDEDELRADACTHDEDGFTDYDSKIGKCVEPPLEIEEGDLEWKN